MSGARAIVTGASGAGKTTLCRDLADAARVAGRDVAGVLCPAVFEGPDKTGIAVTDLRGGVTRELARRRDPGARPDLPPRRWVFEEEALAWGNALLERATPCGLLVVDELGPLEFEEGSGWIAGLAAVDAGRFDAALVVVRPALLARARARWPEAVVVDAAEPDAAARLAAWLAAAGTAR